MTGPLQTQGNNTSKVNMSDIDWNRIADINQKYGVRIEIDQGTIIASIRLAPYRTAPRGGIVSGMGLTRPLDPDDVYGSCERAAREASEKAAASQAHTWPAYQGGNNNQLARIVNLDTDTYAT